MFYVDHVTEISEIVNIFFFRASHCQTKWVFCREVKQKVDVLGLQI